MNEATERRIKEIFQAALEKEAPERIRFLDRVCGEAGTVRARVDALLRAYGEVGDFLADGDAPRPALDAERPGTMIDRYKLLQEIGHGGFGVVYMAEQQEPVRRKVAVKIIKLGMDTKQVIARFEAERQALALMDHPNIAKVLDAGATDQGRPFFVMELVKGIRITEYCDQAKLDTAERLELFKQVCHAVQHAHQKGIIHRDLKPSNVLVTLHDGEPVPKIIDFGIAKATDHHLTEKTLFTEFRQMIGTPEYMAPEQAELSGLDVDTRADIYSLGVLLYELLTGTKPFDLKTLAERGYDEILKTIREVDPPRPSTRLSTMGEELHAVAKSRGTQATLLGRVMRGDLDWIVMKSIEKDRSRRYDTANALAMDVHRYLHDEPVLATPPSRVYRMRKYVRRHRVGVSAAAAVVVALLGGVVFATAAWAETRTQRDVARDAEADAERRRVEAETVVGLVEEMLGAADPRRVNGPGYTVRRLLEDFDRKLGDRLAAHPEAEAKVAGLMGIAYLNHGQPAKAEQHLRRALELAPNDPEAIARWARYCFFRGDYREAEKQTRRAARAGHPEPAAVQVELSEYLRHLGRYEEAEEVAATAVATLRADNGEPHRLAEAIARLADVRGDRGDYADAEKLYREAIAIQKRALAEKHPDVAKTLDMLATVRVDRGDYQEAERLARESLALRKEALGGDHPDIAESLNALTIALLAAEKNKEAEPYARQVLELRMRVHGAEHPAVAAEENNLAVALTSLGRHEEAEQVARAAHARSCRVLGVEHPSTVTTLHNVAYVLKAVARYREAEQLFREALELRRKALGDDHPHVAIILDNLALVRRDLGDLEGAEEIHLRALAMNRGAFGDEHPRIAKSLKRLARVVADQGRLDEAEKLAREAVAMAERLLGPDSSISCHTRNELGAILANRKEWTAAETLNRELLARARRVYGPEAVLVATVAGNLAHVLQEQGHHDEAEPLLRETLRIKRSFYGEVHAKVATATAGLANVLSRKREFQEAEELHRRALAIRRQLFGEHWMVAVSHNNLGLVLEATGRTEDAQESYETALDLLERLTPQHPNRAVTLTNLGRIHRARGNHEQAERRLREALELLRSMQGAGHVRKADALRALADLLEAQGKLEEEEQTRREYLALQQKIHGEKAHPQLAAANGNLGNALSRQEKYAEAEPFFRTALALRLELHGDDHPDISTALNNLALNLGQLLKYEEAERHYLRALEVRRKHDGAVSRRVADTLGLLGGMLANKGDYARATEILEEALDLRRTLHEGGHRSTAVVAVNLGYVAGKAGDLERAARLLDEALGIYRRLDGDPAWTVGALKVHGIMLRDVGQPGNALPLLREAAQLDPTEHGVLALLGDCLIAKREFAEAESVLRKCLALRERTMPQDWLRYNAMNLLGGALAGQRKFAEAETLLLEGYHGMRPPPELEYRKREALERIVKLYEDWGKPDKATAWRQKLDG